MSDSKKRDPYIDILKGIGISSVVLGHAFNTGVYYSQEVDFVRKFVYIYHLAIFFYVNGYLYKNKDLKSFYLKGILKNLYLKSTLFSLFSFLLIPLFSSLHILQGEKLTLKSIVNVLVFHPGRGIYTGALWFVPLLAISMILFDTIMRITKHKFSKLRFYIFLVLGTVGILLIRFNFIKFIIFNRALIVLPIMYFGFISREKANIFYRKHLKWYYCLIISFFICFLNYLTSMEIELSKNILYGFYGFYPMSLLGIFFCLSLANVLSNNKISYVFAYIGKNSFVIMATHFWFFKLFDGVFGNIVGLSKDKLIYFPISFPNIYFRLIYFVLGILVPLSFVFFISKIKKFSSEVKLLKKEY